MDEVIEDFKEVQKELEITDVAAALLVLANAVNQSAPFKSSNAENFGHELAIAMKNVFEERPLRVEKA